jgi:TonB-dependent SusC/RagA subfamily outer membrane receptor
LKGIGSGCDEEAARVLALFPKWQPGRQNGKPVNVKYHLPVNFQLEESDEKTSSSHKEAAKSVATVVHYGTAPLYVLDGKEMKNGDFLKTLPGEEIESMNVLKGSHAEKLYGDKGKNGVVEITSK